MKLKLFNEGCYLLLLFVFLLAGAGLVHADILFESANMGSPGQSFGYPFFSDQYIGARFHISQETRITAIGGHLAANGKMFGAIVQLSGESDYPDPEYFWWDVVAIKEFNPGTYSNDYRTPLSTTLMPGWYALVFGIDYYGSGSSDYGVLPHNGQSTYSGVTYIAGVYDYDWEMWDWFDAEIEGSRFVVEGTTDKPAYLGGSKFHDLDEDGQWDSGEPAIAGWEFYLDLNTNGAFDTGEPNVISDPNGFYQFQVEGGTYTIAEVRRNGWVQSWPAGSGTYTLTVDPNQHILTNHFGNYEWTGTTVTLVGDEDAYVKDTQPDTNFGTEVSLYTGRNNTTYDIYRTYVKFDLSSIPKGYRITSAQLELRSNTIIPSSFTVGAFRTSDGWDEDTITWNDCPSPDDTLPAAQRTVTIGINSWDITQDADDAYAAGKDLSIMLKSMNEASNRYTIFWSRETAIADYRPKLIIQYEPIFGGGTGESDSPFQIWTAEQMNTIGLYQNRWTKHYILMADISLAAYPNSAYHRIGFSSASGEYFAGTFDGNFHTISGFTSTIGQASSYIGIFGYTSNATIKNLNIASPTITDTSHIASYVGGLTGFADSSDIYNCRVEGGTVEGNHYVGGLIGYLGGSYVADCSASAAVSAVNNVGGLVGSASGFLSGGSHITDCCAAGSVTGTDFVGGFIGNSSENIILNCYSSGAVSGTTNVGGFSGYNENVYYPGTENVLNCFWDKTTSGRETSAAGTGLLTAQMKDSNTYINAGWDFVGETANGGSDDWAMSGANSYPVLWHQLPTPPALPAFAGGDGSQAAPYLIATVSQLNSIGHNYRLMNKHFRLTADLDLDGVHFYRIAQRPYPFTGTFDGNNHSIRNLTIDGDFFYVSSFGFIGWLYGSNARVENLTLTEPNVSNTWAVETGALVGFNQSATIENCHIIDGTIRGFYDVGGLVGFSYWHATISNCSVTGTVQEGGAMSMLNTGVGGLAGISSFWSQIQNSYAIVDVHGDDLVGGLVGDCSIYGTVTNCYSRGTLYATENTVGGLLGRTSGGTVTNCYSSCKIQAAPTSTQTGSLVGKDMDSSTFTGCLWDSEINGALAGFGQTAASTQIINTNGDTTANMHLSATFTAKSWDFATLWTICEGTSYPKFQWHIPTGADFVCPDGVGLEDFTELANCWKGATEVHANIADNQWVNLADLAFMSQWWMDTNCDGCGGADITGDDNVNIEDLDILIEEWLYKEMPVCSIVELSGDKKIDLQDLMIFCERWLMQR